MSIFVPTKGDHSSLIDTGRQSLSSIFKDLDAISQLAPNDIAYVKRSTGEWHPAIVVKTSAAHEEDMYIKFLLDTDGHTKTIPASKWTNLIRMNRPVRRSFGSTSMASFGSFAMENASSASAAKTDIDSVDWNDFLEEDFDAEEVVKPRHAFIGSVASAKQTASESASWFGLFEDDASFGGKAYKPRSPRCSTTNAGPADSDSVSWFGLFEDEMNDLKASMLTKSGDQRMNDLKASMVTKPGDQGMNDLKASMLTKPGDQGMNGLKASMVTKDQGMNDLKASMVTKPGDQGVTKPGNKRPQRLSSPKERKPHKNGSRGRKNVEEKVERNQYKRSASSDSHQRAFLSALASIDISSSNRSVGDFRTKSSVF